MRQFHRNHFPASHFPVTSQQKSAIHTPGATHSHGLIITRSLTVAVSEPLFQHCVEFRADYGYSQHPATSRQIFSASQTSAPIGDCIRRLRQRLLLHVPCVLPSATEPSRQLLHLTVTVCRRQYDHRRHSRSRLRT